MGTLKKVNLSYFTWLAQLMGEYIADTENNFTRNLNQSIFVSIFVASYFYLHFFNLLKIAHGYNSSPRRPNSHTDLTSPKSRCAPCHLVHLPFYYLVAGRISTTTAPIPRLTRYAITYPATPRKASQTTRLTRGYSPLQAGGFIVTWARSARRTRKQILLQEQWHQVTLRRIFGVRWPG